MAVHGRRREQQVVEGYTRREEPPAGGGGGEGGAGDGTKSNSHVISSLHPWQIPLGKVPVSFFPQTVSDIPVTEHRYRSVLTLKLHTCVLLCTVQVHSNIQPRP